MGEEAKDKMLETIQEFANIGAGSAATALSSLMNMELMNDVTSCKILPLSQVAEYLGGPDKVVAGSYTQLVGPLRSGILVVLPGESATSLLQFLTREKIELASLTRLQRSALREVGNICLCWYLIAVSKMVDTDMIPTPPDATVDLLGAVLDLPLAALGAKVDTVIAVHTRFKGIEKEFEGYFLMLPEEATLSLIMRKMGEKV